MKYDNIIKNSKAPKEQMALAACAVARLCLHLIPEGEERPRIAIETAEAWIKGATAEQAEHVIRTREGIRDFSQSAHCRANANVYWASEAAHAATYTAFYKGYGVYHIPCNHYIDYLSSACFCAIQAGIPEKDVCDAILKAFYPTENPAKPPATPKPHQVCAVARLCLPLIPEGEERPRIAIETAEAWCRGEATEEQVIRARDNVRDLDFANTSANVYYAEAAVVTAIAAVAAVVTQDFMYDTVSSVCYCAIQAGIPEEAVNDALKKAKDSYPTPTPAVSKPLLEDTTTSPTPTTPTNYNSIIKNSEATKEQLIMASCAVARLCLPLIPLREERPRIAIETTESWARGEATAEQVNEAGLDVARMHGLFYGNYNAAIAISFAANTYGERTNGTANEAVYYTHTNYVCFYAIKAGIPEKDVCDALLKVLNPPAPEVSKTPPPTNTNPPDPIPMFLTCPICSTRHIDEGDFATKPHHTHDCHNCGLNWRPALVPTVGVKFLGFQR